MRGWLPVAHLVMAAIILLWDVVLGARIAQLRQASRSFAAVSGLAALLIVPAVIAGIATSTVITGRAIRAMDWLWPAVLLLFAVQAVYALSRRVVNPMWGIPIAIYDMTIATAGIARYLITHGNDVPQPFLVLVGAQHAAMASIVGATALTSSIFVHVPMISPAFPALRRATASFRLAVTAVAIAWMALIGLQLPTSDRAMGSYAGIATERLTERPAADFQVGVKVFPDLARPPSPAAVATDLALVDTLGVNVVNVVITPGASLELLNSTAKALSELQRDSAVLIVTLGYHGALVPHPGGVSLDERRRLEDVRRAVATLRPDIIFPALDPYGIGARLVGRLPLDRWERFYTDAAAIVKRTRPRTAVGVSISAFDSRDSALYAWAARPASPIDVVGLSLFPTRLGATQLNAETRAADRWMVLVPPTKPHWVFTGGYALVHGERAQALAIWKSLVWSTSRPAVKGLVVWEAGDYGSSRGLRAPDGHMRAAGFAVLRALRGLSEAAAASAVPTAPTR